MDRKKRKNTNVLKELIVKDNWLIYRKIIYFGHIKCHDGLERTLGGHGLQRQTKKMTTRY
uniref:Uncharacterized protein n=1 Tax=Arion vulgaris TaxID=1028688 RepID=A0A0B7ADZ1_9EUPU